MLLAIDPGRDSAWAVFSDGKLTDVGFRLEAGWPPPGYAWPLFDRVVVEDQRVFAKSNPVDMIKLAHDAGERVGVARYEGAVCQYVHPNTWKGGPLKKEIHHPRVLARLTDGELATLTAALGPKPSKAKREAILDAVGIGLWAVGRRA